ncbi:receptor-like protein kinase FERONIA [Trifolium pratense]|uniref:receptor-like protein kinase FERONIA n=1 Tax=Trifolium pratense TaxID=57577 RepID=UPI001E690D20|nr:receptor-like protein kinase FERONIA [Trifolium pratense]
MANSINKKLYTKITLLSLFLLLCPLVANSYNPIYNLAINCGSSTNTTSLDNRIWIGDNIDNINLFSFIEPKTTNPSFKTSPNSLSNTQIPFTTARVSLSNFTYSFSNIITNSPVFIRLHFYPTLYQNFEPTNAVFSVKVNNNNFSLLKNFNPSLWLNDANEEKITKEYCIQIKQNENLNITFIPNNINTSNVYYAFINGIEVVSMPSFLYYTNLDDTNYHFKFIGSDNTEYQIRNDKALEMVYRVNVGANQVPPSNDTGMFRDWKNDFPLYLEKEYPLSVSSDFGEHLNYLKNTVPNYTAPEVVYLTARSYGMNVTVDYNVTWNFEVDSNFTYMKMLM